MVVDMSQRFTGALIERTDPRYEAARMARVYHSRHPDRYPAAVLLAESENDVVEGVRLANERGWSIGVRSGGHSFPVWSVRDDALLIDLGGLNELSLDEETGVVLVSPAVQGGAELTPYLKAYGRFFPGGGCSSVGLGGFLLQGGMGWNQRGWGYAAEQILAVDVVTADGDLVRADEVENQDLFWAVRGAGPGFPGVVTRFHLQTRPIPAGLASTLQIYPLASYPKVLEWLCEVQANIPDSVHLLCMSANPPVPVPNHEGGYIFAVLGVALCNTPEESSEALALLRECPFIDEALTVSDAQPTTIEEQHAFVDASHPPGLRYRVDSAWVEGPYAEIVAATQTLVVDRPNERAGHTFFWFTLPRETPDMAMTLQSRLMVGAYIIYEDEADDENYRDWSLSAMAHLQPYTVGQYWGDSDQQHREVKCLTDDGWVRLQKIREHRDPHGRFVGYLAKDSGFRNINGWEPPA